MKKRGALELSMSVIVIIVIAVTLLTLGLMFVRGVFFQLTELSEGVFERGQQEIVKITQGESKLDFPNEVTVKQGKAKIFEISVGNDGTEPDGTKFTLSIERQDCPTGVTCPTATQVRAEIVEPPTIILDKGEIYPFNIKVAAITKAPVTTGIDTPTYVVTVNAGGERYARGVFYINVEKGFFIF